MIEKLKSLILAAGQGSRLRPLTSSCPKPLLPVLGLPLLAITAHKIRTSLNLKNVAVNAFYLKEQIAEFCDTANLHCSLEREPIDTGGAIDALKPWIHSSSLLVHSGDVVSSMDLNALKDAHFSAQDSGQVMATIYVVPHVAGETAIDVQNGLLRGFGVGRYTFANAYILSPDFVSEVPNGKSGIIETFKKILADGGKIQALVWNGYWKNLNRIEDYVALHQDLLRDPTLTQNLLIKDLLMKENSQHQLGQRKFLRQKADAKNIVLGDWVVVHGPLDVQQRLQLDRCLIMQDSIINQPFIQNQVIGKNYCIDIEGMWTD